MTRLAPTGELGGAAVLVIGTGQLAVASVQALEVADVMVRRLEDPNNREIREALDGRIERVVVISRFDYVSLRKPWSSHNACPGISLLVTRRPAPA